MFRLTILDEDLQFEEIPFEKIIKKYITIIEEEFGENIPIAQYSFMEIDTGIGASGPEILFIFAVAKSLFFEVPALYKKVKESIKGWKEIYQELMTLLSGFRKRSVPIKSYSVEIALLFALNQLSSRVDVDELTIEAVIEIPGKGTIHEGASFQTASISQYFFLFRDDRDVIYSVSLNSRLDVNYDKGILLDPRLLK